MKAINEKLIKAAKVGNTTELKKLLQKPGCNALSKAKEGWTALMHAAYGGQEACVRLLLPVSDVLAKAKNGQTALMWAAGFGYEACVRLLLPASDALAKDTDGWTPLIWAAGAGHEDCLRILLPVSDVQARDKKGLTARSSARLRGNKNVAQLIDAYALAQNEQGSIGAAAGPGASSGRLAPRM